MKIRFFLVLITAFTIYNTLNAQNVPLIYKINLKKEIGSTSWIYVRNGLNEADSLKASCIILHMNTYGGAVLYADSIRTAILNNSIPVYAFIDNNAASAGALIAIACDSIYMRKGANIGAATVVDQSGDVLPDKYQSYMRATIRATAEAHGADTTFTAQGDTLLTWKRDPKIAEAMVDDRICIPQVIDSGKILTFTAQEAIQHRYCEGLAENIDQVITDKLHIKEYVLKEYKPTLYDEIKGFLINPAFQAILIMLILAGIYLEMQSPGIGFPLAIAITAAVLYFAPLYIDGMAAYWEIILFLIGVACMAVEIFVIPGFGLTGVAGAILMLVGLILATVNNVDFNFDPVHASDINRSVLTVVCGIALGFFAILYLSNKIGKKGFFRRIALNTSQEISAGYIGVPEDMQHLVGKTGIASTILRPAGRIIIDNERYDAVALYGYIEPETPVKVVKYENSQLYVTVVKNNE